MQKSWQNHDKCNSRILNISKNTAADCFYFNQLVCRVQTSVFFRLENPRKLHKSDIKHSEPWTVPLIPSFYESIFIFGFM